MGSGNRRSGELLQQVKEGTVEAYAHQDLPFEKLVAELDMNRDMSRHPLFQVMFVLQNQPVAALRNRWEAPAVGIGAARLTDLHCTAKFDLGLDFIQTGEGLGTAGVCNGLV